MQASLDYKQRLQQLFFPGGIAYDGNRFNRTAVTAPLFKYLAPSESADERVVSPTGIEPVSVGLPAKESRSVDRTGGGVMGRGVRLSDSTFHESEDFECLPGWQRLRPTVLRFEACVACMCQESLRLNEMERCFQ